MIISFVNQKGGVGKTTMAINIAHALSTRNKVLLIDTDPQGSVGRWQGISGASYFDVLHHPKVIHQKIEALSAGYTHTVIDAPPGISELTLSCLLSSDMAIIPITPSPLDIWASDDILPLASEAKTYRPGLAIKILITKKQPNTVVGREVRQALEYYRMEIFKTEIGHRIAYVNAMINGETVLSHAPMSAPAREISALLREILTNKEKKQNGKIIKGHARRSK